MQHDSRGRLFRINKKFRDAIFSFAPIYLHNLRTAPPTNHRRIRLGTYQQDSLGKARIRRHGPAHRMPCTFLVRTRAHSGKCCTGGSRIRRKVLAQIRPQRTWCSPGTHLHSDARNLRASFQSMA
jgi:hypothetical protein